MLSRQRKSCHPTRYTSSVGVPKGNPVDRFWKRVDVRRDSECWLWRGSHNKAGYGDFVVHDTYERGRWKVQAHAFALLLVGIDSSGKSIHHLCHKPSCVNPLHLQVVTPAEHAVAHGRVKWTEESIVSAIQDFARRYGAAPAALDWNPGMARRKGNLQRAQRWEENDWPPVSTVQRVFGSWAEGLKAAGFQTQIGRRPKGLALSSLLSR